MEDNTRLLIFIVSRYNTVEGWKNSNASRGQVVSMNVLKRPGVDQWVW
jgi:hypothetical protein